MLRFAALQRPQHAASKLPCLVLSSAIIVSPQYLSRSSLHRLAGLPCRLFLSLWSPSGDMRGPSIFLEAVNRPSPGPFRFSHSVHYIHDFCPLSLTQMLALLYLYVMLSILLSILLCAACYGSIDALDSVKVP